jgi:hypothetical protein
MMTTMFGRCPAGTGEGDGCCACAELVSPIAASAEAATRELPLNNRSRRFNAAFSSLVMMWTSPWRCKPFGHKFALSSPVGDYCNFCSGISGLRANDREYVSHIDQVACVANDPSDRNRATAIAPPAWTANSPRNFEVARNCRIRKFDDSSAIGLCRFASVKPFVEERARWRYWISQAGFGACRSSC